MKFLHEMMPIFRNEFSEFPRRGIYGITIRRASISANCDFDFKNSAGVITPLFIEFNGMRSRATDLKTTAHNASTTHERNHAVAPIMHYWCDQVRNHYRTRRRNVCATAWPKRWRTLNFIIWNKNIRQIHSFEINETNN